VNFGVANLSSYAGVSRMCRVLWPETARIGFSQIIEKARRDIRRRDTRNRAVFERAPLHKALGATVSSDERSANSATARVNAAMIGGLR